MIGVSAIQARLERALLVASRADDRELALWLRDEGHRLVFLMNGLLRGTRLYALDNQALDSPADELHEVLSRLLERLGVVHVVFVEDQVYVNDVRLRIRASEQVVVDQLVAELGRHEVGGLSLHQPLDANQWKRLAQALASPAEGSPPSTVLRSRLAEIADIDVAGRFCFKLGDEREAGPKPHAEVLGRAEAALLEGLGRLAAGRMPNPLPVRRAVIDLVESLAARPQRAALAPFAGPSSLGASERHLLSVCQLSLMLGRTLGLSKAALSDVGVAAMFHDVGYLRPTTRDNHALAGTRLLLRQRGFSEAKLRRLLTVLEHHADYLDMSHEGESPGLFARILRVAEDYDLLTAPRSNNPAPLSPCQALARMWAGRGSKYDPILMALFTQALGLYPPGTLLELADFRLAVSIGGGRGRERFAHPVVRIVREADGTAASGAEELDLYERREPSLAVGDASRVAPDVLTACRTALAAAAA